MNQDKELKFDSPEKIREAARIVIEKFRRESDLGEAFGYNRESLRRVDAFIDQHARQAAPDEKGCLVQLIGAYLGEFMIQEYGCVWRLDHGYWVLEDELTLTTPFHSVWSVFEQAAKGSPSDLFERVKVMWENAMPSAWCFGHRITEFFLGRDSGPICRACHPPISWATIEAVEASEIEST